CAKTAPVADTIIAAAKMDPPKNLNTCENFIIKLRIAMNPEKSGERHLLRSIEYFRHLCLIVQDAFRQRPVAFCLADAGQAAGRRRRFGPKNQAMPIDTT